MDFPKVLFLFLLSIVSLSFSQEISCDFFSFGPRFYVCEMRLANVSDSVEISGDHLNSKSNRDVMRVDLSGNSTIFPPQICSRFENLKKIVNFEVKISKIAESSLNSCLNLMELRLDSVGLEEISENAFDQTKKLEILQLNSNQLFSLPENLFEHLKNLRELNLAGNPLETLSENLLTPLGDSLERLSLSNCNMSCSWNPKWLRDLQKLDFVDLGWNQITEIPQNSLNPRHKLTTLLIDHNRIKMLDFISFETLENLQILHAGNNAIEGLDFYIFDTPTELNYVNLELNSCVDRIFTNFYENKNENLQILQTCFKNFRLRSLEFNLTTESELTFNTFSGNSLNVEIQAPSDAIIVFKDKLKDGNWTVEVVIGAENNTMNKLIVNGDLVQYNNHTYLNSNIVKNFEFRFQSYIYIHQNNDIIFLQPTSAIQFQYFGFLTQADHAYFKVV